MRIGQLEEAVQIIRKMWTETEVYFEGRYYRIRGAVCSPKPEPAPPIMIGGGGERLTLRVVAKHADWWNIPNASVETFKRKLDVLVKHCEEVGRRPEEVKKTLATVVAVAGSRGEALRLAMETPFIRSGELDNFIVGDPVEVARKVEKYLELGVEYFILRFADFPKTDGARVFAEKVMSEFV